MIFKQLSLPGVLTAASASSFKDGEESVLSNGGVGCGWGGVERCSLGSLLGPVVEVRFGGDGGLQFLVNAKAWLYDK